MTGPVVTPAVTAPTPPRCIRTGGQTGVDRAATDVAVSLGLPYAGFVPAGGWAEDAPEPPGVLARYGCFEPTESPDPAVRTRRNVEASDAVLILRADAVASPGTDLTVELSRQLGRPCAIVDPRDPRAPAKVAALLDAVRPLDLLVAGPRASEDAGAYDAAARLLTACADALVGRGA